jgi:hypothetical protein
MPRDFDSALLKSEIVIFYCRHAKGIGKVEVFHARSYQRIQPEMLLQDIVFSCDCGCSFC